MLSAFADLISGSLWTLYALNDGNEHTQREICSVWDLPKSTVNTVVSELKQNGHVTLTPIKGKRREMTVTLTEQGRAYAASLLAEVYKKEAAAFAMLTDDERSVIAHLEKIAACLREEAAK